MLQETDDRLEKLQTEVGEVTTGSTTTPSLPPGSYCPPTVPISSPENSSEQGIIHILHKHFYSTKLNLTFKFFTKTGFFRQIKTISFSTLHSDKNFMQ